jgi:hypothetical protein
LVADTGGESRDVLWAQSSAVLQALDVPRLLHLAEHAGAHIGLCVIPGETIFGHSSTWERN